VKYLFALLLPFFTVLLSNAQYTHQDTLRGSNGSGRSWWDVQQYHINVAVDIDNKTIKGTNRINFNITNGGKNKVMQIDMQMPMRIDRIEFVQMKYGTLPFRREGNVCWVDFGEREFKTGDTAQAIIVHFSGKPRAAVRAPWDGGWVWAKDAKGRPWVTVACQGLGASVWYPCKDIQSDEPDKGATLGITVPDSLVAVGNGRLIKKTPHADSTLTWLWEVKNPINNYNIIPYIGKYVNWEEKFAGAKGELDCSYWVLDYNLEKARTHFERDTKPMLACFEDWFGPYPFYEDSYKMVEAPHLGMEHQSAVAYGNQYKDGYLGMDLSGTGWGLKWDYIIVHESGHEWFANNITTKDIADMWVHEGFTTYSEVLYVECRFGKEAADEYCQGLRTGIENNGPIIGPYGVNKEGSGDMYPKGANMIHTIRQIINDDAKFKAILRGLNQTYYHKITTSAEVEKYIISQSGKKLEKVFDQYLRTAKVPLLEYKLTPKPGVAGAYTLRFRWSNVIEGFAMPMRIFIDKKPMWITPKTTYQTISIKAKSSKSLEIDPNFYIISQQQ
jgi:aminopeptidase N